MSRRKFKSIHLKVIFKMHLKVARWIKHIKSVDYIERLLSVNLLQVENSRDNMNRWTWSNKSSLFSGSFLKQITGRSIKFQTVLRIWFNGQGTCELNCKIFKIDKYLFEICFKTSTLYFQPLVIACKSAHEMFSRILETSSQQHVSTGWCVWFYPWRGNFPFSILPTFHRFPCLEMGFREFFLYDAVSS